MGKRSGKTRGEIQTKRAQTKPDRFIVAYVHPGETSAYFTHSITGMTAAETRTGRLSNVIQEWSSANISDSRNELVRRFLAQTDADWLLFVDADMAFDPLSFHYLRESADPVERPIVGGLCFGASNGRLFPTIYQFVKGDDGKPLTMRVNEVPEDTLLQVGATGAAFLLLHRSALVKIRDRAFNATFPWFQETELSGKPCGEDITFCIRAGMCGIPVYVNTGVQVGHHKSQLLTLAEFNAQQGGGTDGDD